MPINAEVRPLSSLCDFLSLPSPHNNETIKTTFSSSRGYRVYPQRLASWQVPGPRDARDGPEQPAEKTREEVQTLVAVVESREKEKERRTRAVQCKYQFRRSVVVVGCSADRGGCRWQIQRGGRRPGADGLQSQDHDSHELVLSHRSIHHHTTGLSESAYPSYD